jgi:hypothetical protein
MVDFSRNKVAVTGNVPFYQGISSNSKRVGHEERNCLLLCLLIYTSSSYEYYSSMLDPKKRSKRKKGNNGTHHKTKRLDFLIELLSESLHLEEFMMQKLSRKPLSFLCISTYRYFYNS